MFCRRIVSRLGKSSKLGFCSLRFKWQIQDVHTYLFSCGPEAISQCEYMQLCSCKDRNNILLITKVMYMHEVVEMMSKDGAFAQCR